jgi:hypothetical protein
VIIILIVTLFAFILAPFSVEISVADNTIPRILKLNVCHTGNAFITGSVDLPYLLHNEIILPAPLELCNVEISPQRYIDLLICFQVEEPPQA